MKHSASRQAQHHITTRVWVLPLAGLLLIACNPSSNSNHVGLTASPLLENTLAAVTCIGGSHCVAVGSIRTRSHADMYKTLIEESDGKNWVVVPSPNAGTYQSNALRAVACSTLDHCIAVGSTGGIACVTDTDCQGVGSGEGTTLVEENTGHGWEIVPSPNAGSFDGGGLSGVACATPNHCIAVGSYDVGGTTQTLIEENAGNGWQVVPSPDPTCTKSTICDTSLDGVACATATLCIAVGSYGSDRTLIEANAGHGWQIMPSSNTTPNCTNPTGCEHPFLDGVTCADPTHCVAVGMSAGSDIFAGFRSMVEENRGGDWFSVEAPGDGLSAVACGSGTDCIAVGFDTILENAGAGWAVVPSPAMTNSGCDPPIGCEATLSGVSCATKTDCFAVGDFGNAIRPKQTLVEQTTGSRWVIVASPNVTIENSPTGASS
jgi:hypothetical protein